MPNRGQSYLRPPKGDPVDREVYELQEAAVRGAARCAAAGIRTFVPRSMRDDVLHHLTGPLETPAYAQPAGRGVYLIQKTYR